MNESFTSVSQEVSKNEKLPLNITNRFSHLKEYIKTLPEHVQKCSALTVLFLLGVFSVAEAQNVDSNMDKTIDGLRSGSVKIENAVDSIYSSYKKTTNDSTFSYVEYFDHVKNNKESFEVKFSGPDMAGGQMGDTVSMGNYEAMEFSVIITNDSKTNGAENLDQEGRFLSAVKPYNGEIKNNDENAVSYVAVGKTKQETIISAIAGLAGFKNSEISVTSLSSDKPSFSNGQDEFISHSTEVICNETKKTILENVKIVVTQTTDGFSVEAFCN